MCKVRGISLNYFASQLVNFEVITDMILRVNKGDEAAVVNVHRGEKIKRKTNGGGTVSIFTEAEDKISIMAFFKRRRLGENMSVPFGYK